MQLSGESGGRQVMFDLGDVHTERGRPDGTLTITDNANGGM